MVGRSYCFDSAGGAGLANRTKMPMWTAKSSGTMKPGIKSHGSVVRLTAGVFFAFSTFGDEGSGPPAGSAGHRRDCNPVAVLNRWFFSYSSEQPQRVSC
jgi:hypothetical protein